MERTKIIRKNIRRIGALFLTFIIFGLNCLYSSISFHYCHRNPYHFRRRGSYRISGFETDPD